MSDHDDTENNHALDHITAALALVDLAGELHDLAVNHKTFRSALKKLAALEKKNAAAEQKLSRLQTDSRRGAGAAVWRPGIPLPA